MVTITDISKELKISHSAVSRVLNGKGKGLVRKDIAEKIIELAKKRGYRPNVSARTLKTGRSGTLGLVTGEISERYQGCFAQALLNESAKHGYRLLISTTNYDQEQERECLENLLNCNVDGIFYQLYLDPGSSIYKTLKKEKFPILSYSVPGDFSALIYDHEHAVRDCMEAFRSKGIRKLIHLTWNHDTITETLKSSAANTGIKLEHISFDPLDRYDVTVFQKLMEKKPEAVFSSSYLEILHLLEYCKENKLKKPFCSYRWTLPFEYIEDPAVIGAIVMPLKERIDAEFQLLLERVRDREKDIRTVVLGSEFLPYKGLKKLNMQLRMDSWYKKYT